MTSTTLLAPAVPATTAVVAVRPARRAAVAVTGLLACALPLVWGAASAGMLVTGAEADHRFHQVTGQGVLLSLLWLAGLVPMVRAGWRGRRPSTATGLHALAFAAAAGTACTLAPQAGAGGLGVVVAVTLALLWAALPQRPRLRGAFRGGLDVALLPVALLTTALVVPFALGEVDLQRAMGDEHAEMAHYVDMAWVVLAVAALGLVASLSAAARSLALWSSAGLLVTGAARAAFTGDTTWSALAVALGAVGLAVAGQRVRSARTAS